VLNAVHGKSAEGDTNNKKSVTSPTAPPRIFRSFFCSSMHGDTTLKKSQLPSSVNCGVASFPKKLIVSKLVNFHL